jgi:hypothetical protein
MASVPHLSKSTNYDKVCMCKIAHFHPCRSRLQLEEYASSLLQSHLIHAAGIGHAFPAVAGAKSIPQYPSSMIRVE